MEVNNANEPEHEQCRCNPLRKIYRLFYVELLRSFNLDAYDLSKIHLFYNSKSTSVRILSQHEYEFKISDTIMKMLNTFVKKSVDQSDLNIVDFLEQHQGEITEVLRQRGVTFSRFGNDVLLKINAPLVNGSILKYLLMDPPAECHPNIFKVGVYTGPATRESGDLTLFERRQHLTFEAIAVICRKLGHVPPDGRKFISVPLDSLDFIVLLKARPRDAPAPENKDEEDKYGSGITLLIGRLSAKGMFDATEQSIWEALVKERTSLIESLCKSSTDCHGNTLKSTSAENLAMATLHYDVLNQDSHKDVKLFPQSKTIKNHDAIFVIYNYARVVSVLKRFSMFVEQRQYDPLPEIDDIDFSVLGVDPDERRLMHLLMEWPMLLESVINFATLECNLKSIGKFGVTLAKALNKCYSRRILLPPNAAQHLLSLMMARIYVMKAVGRVFEDILDILRVKHSNIMGFDGEDYYNEV